MIEVRRGRKEERKGGIEGSDKVGRKELTSAQGGRKKEKGGKGCKARKGGKRVNRRRRKRRR